MRVKPILFNTDMVRAILDGRKTVTRRVMKPQPRIEPYDFGIDGEHDICEAWVGEPLQRGYIALGVDAIGNEIAAYMKKPYRKGDVLYVRETWCFGECWDCGHDSQNGCIEKPSPKFYNDTKQAYGCYWFRASFEDNEVPFGGKWHPSTHMPKEAARIWLKVTDVRVERLQDMTEDDVIKEGIGFDKEHIEVLEDHYDIPFAVVWDSEIKKKDLPLYGWDANPWVWVIEFERCEKGAFNE